MHLVVGLGNPGAQYVGTRHNVGFAVIDKLAQAGAIEGFRGSKRALVARARLGGADCLLAKPQTFMNLSGEPVAALATFYRLEAHQVLVVHDELDFLPGLVRLKPGGGHGGHNGLRSLMLHLKGDFNRVRLGVGKPPRDGAGEALGVAHVLGRATGAQGRAIEAGIDEAAAAVIDILREGMAAAMGHLNRRDP